MATLSGSLEVVYPLVPTNKLRTPSHRAGAEPPTRSESPEREIKLVRARGELEFRFPAPVCVGS